jgi:hypothetical protein
MVVSNPPSIPILTTFSTVAFLAGSIRAAGISASLLQEFFEPAPLNLQKRRSQRKTGPSAQSPPFRNGSRRLDGTARLNSPRAVALLPPAAGPPISSVFCERRDRPKQVRQHSRCPPGIREGHPFDSPTVDAAFLDRYNLAVLRRQERQHGRTAVWQPTGRPKGNTPGDWAYQIARRHRRVGCRKVR